jgi:hypothetical protein
MAVQRLSLSDIETAILEITGYELSTLAPWKTSARLYTRVNEYIQRLPQKVTTVAKQAGLIEPTSGPLRFDMWKSTATITGTIGSQDVWLPTDYDHWISFYDLLNNATIDPIQEVDKYHVEGQRNASPGPTKNITVLGYALNVSVWQRKGKVYPPVESTVIPSLSLTYWRIPAKMAGSSPTTEYPDIDPKYESIAIHGTVCDLARPSSPEYSVWKAKETEILAEMALTARSM